MEIPKTYDPSATETKWYHHWMKEGFFNSVPDDREPYTIVIPPPNVTGVLHMGHMLNNTIQDVLIRRARMQGKNACWVPGTDHASIATEAKVVAMLKEKGISKQDLSREEFLKYAWDWKEKYGGIILEQLKKLGASCDWNRTRFTMEDDLSDAVIEVFIDLYRKGQIYRGTRMVNWDPAGLTAVSDEEVIHKEVDSTLYHVRYQVEGMDEWITIATTRPETILGDTAVCVHPNDERYKHLHGKRIIVPIAKRSVPLITDEYVTMEFGTGALKVTPAHDINDYQLGLKHKLQIIDTLTPDGKLSEAAGFYVGEDRFVVRKKIVKDLDAAGHLVKSEPYKSNVGFSERTNAVIEPRISMQWFLKMDKISKPALENVMNDNIRLVPDKFKNTYRHWMENVHDWCISRQLWWGQRIPAWYDESGNCVVAKTESEARTLFGAEDASFNDQSKITQDEDVLDTWFSSWLWPISVFDGFKDPNNADIKYYYPTNDLVTAPEILFFWVARMIIAGYEYRGEKPFTNVYLTGIVRDKLGRKMSKSLGNSPDPLDLIEKYGADGVRTGMLFSSPAGNDLPFDEGLCEQGRNFANKIWNAFRLIHGWSAPVDSGSSDQRDHSASIEWFEAKLSAEIENINDLFSKYRISEALLAIYKLIWDDFCSWYLEIVKPPLGQTMRKETYEVTVSYFEALMKVLHPFMPFITEEIWHSIRERSEKDCIIVAQWPNAVGSGQSTVNSRQSTVGSQQRRAELVEASAVGSSAVGSSAVGSRQQAVGSNQLTDEKSTIIQTFEAVQALVTGIRNLRKSKNIPNKEPLTVYASRAGSLDRFHGVVEKLCNLNPVSVVAQKSSDLVPILANGHEYFIDIRGKVNQDDERKRIEEELNYTRGFLESVNKKLGNEKFMANAKPEVVASENKKKSDAESKIRMLEEQLAGM